MLTFVIRTKQVLPVPLPDPVRRRPTSDESKCVTRNGTHDITVPCFPNLGVLIRMMETERVG